MSGKIEILSRAAAPLSQDFLQLAFRLAGAAVICVGLTFLTAAFLTVPNVLNVPAADVAAVLHGIGSDSRHSHWRPRPLDRCKRRFFCLLGCDRDKGDRFRHGSAAVSGFCAGASLASAMASW